MKISDNVKYILATNHNARNSDRELLVAYMELCEMGLTEHQKEIFRYMPSMETIRRIRQKVQERGLFLADKQIKRERNFRAATIQQNIPTTSPDKVERLVEPHKTFIQKAIPWLDKDDQ